MSRVVLLHPSTDDALLLADITRQGGKIVRAYVVNGAWNLSDAPDLDISGYREVPVPNAVKGDYNEVIEWARNQ